jgi:hypothetical protein
MPKSYRLPLMWKKSELTYLVCLPFNKISPYLGEYKLFLLINNCFAFLCDCTSIDFHSWSELLSRCKQFGENQVPDLYKTIFDKVGQKADGLRQQSHRCFPFRRIHEPTATLTAFYVSLSTFLHRAKEEDCPASLPQIETVNNFILNTP